MRLFLDQGYQETTVDQIADAAEVSPSTFFRYFPTKEDVVLDDEYDPLLIEFFRAQPPELTPIEAVRASIGAVFDSMTPEARKRERVRHKLMLEVPELKAAMLDEYTRSMRLIAELVAERLGRDPADLSIRVFAGALIGVVIAVIGDTITEGWPWGYRNQLDDAFQLLADGLPL